MLHNNIIFIVIIVLIAFAILSVVVNESFCNCLGTGVKYASHSPASYASYGGGGYKSNYGWPVGMPYDSLVRQRLRKRDANYIPNMKAVNKMVCTPDMFQSTYSVDNKPIYSEDDQTKCDMMVQSPEMSYKMVYNDTRGPGRYGYGSNSGGMTSYSLGDNPTGCGFPLLDAGPPTHLGPGGSFHQPPPTHTSSGYNLSVGVM